MLEVFSRIINLIENAKSVGLVIRVPILHFPFHHILRVEVGGSIFFTCSSSRKLFPAKHSSSRWKAGDWKAKRHSFGAIQNLWEFCVSCGPIRTQEFVSCVDKIEKWIDQREVGLKNFKSNLECVTPKWLRRAQSKGIDPRFCILLEERRKDEV